MIYKIKLGTVDPDLPAGERWFARQIEGHFGQSPDEKLPLDMVLLLRELEKDKPSGA
jgi:hypothetical protein